ncbi:MAG: nickel pincer cofactor biosynthesis protein LarB [Candidatus Omnitrophica bacterium]|nr:nickel pincer cofactor biosynthesis protein LarB [Candidatus Omnitrophota bacterium]
MYDRSSIKRLLKRLSSKSISVKEAYGILCDLPYKDIGFAKIDSHRMIRRGFPEVIFCRKKTPQQVEGILKAVYGKNKALILSHASERLFKGLKKNYKGLLYNRLARMIYQGGIKPKGKKRVLIVTGGTSDLPIAEEARLTLSLMGNSVSILSDVGVAGIHRLLGNKKRLLEANVIVVIAGMEGALASVVSGLVSKPVIAVPTSVGYGANFKGIAPLLTMLNSCSPGIGVVNIDNGFGAGYLASLINHM